jgi:hypothetical protein
VDIGIVGSCGWGLFYRCNGRHCGAVL